MHGWRGTEGCDGRRRRLVRLMWPAARVEAEAPPSPATATSSSSRFSVLPPRTTSYQLAAVAAREQECVDSLRPVSPGSFIKDGREIQVGDCALFRAVDGPPFIGLIRWIEKKGEGYPKLRVSWLYRPADIKLNKGIQLNAAPNEIFYSFHQDEASAVSLLHPCKVAFLRKGVELPVGISSFVCWRVYDTDNKCLWWLTDRDYINERQEEVNRLLYRTRLEMHAAVQSGGRSPKLLNGSSALQQLKISTDGTQNCGLSRGKKRERGEQGIDPAKRDRDRMHVDDSEPGSKLDDIKFEIAKVEKGGLPNAEAVEKLVHLMQLDQTEHGVDLACRVMLADVIAATESPDCLGRFVQSRGLSVLDSWLQEAHKGKSGDGSSKDADKPIDDLLLALLRALAKLPINLSALQSCSIGKSVNHLRSHKNLEIQKKAKCLVENWKKRVDAEMKSNDLKPLTGQSASWPGKAGFQETSNTGSKRGGSSEHSPKNLASTVSSKVLTDKPGGTDAVAKLNHAVNVSSKVQHMQSGNVATNLKDQPCKSTGGFELPTVKEEKSSNLSQSPNNSQSCSSEPSKDARSSTAASGVASRTSGSSSRGHRKATNGLVSGSPKEASVGRCVSLDRSFLPDKSSPTGSASEKGVEMPSDHGNNHRQIVRFPNPGRSPARSASGGSFEDPSITGGRASSPVVADRHEQTDRRVKMKTENSRPHLTSDVNAESWHTNGIKGTAGSEEGDKSPCAMLDDDNSRTPDDSVKDAHASRVVCSASPYMNEKGVCSSETKVGNSFSPMNALIEIKYSEASHSFHAGDDTAMDLLASVAGEISKSELVSPSSPRNSSAKKLGCDGDNAGKVKAESDVGPTQDLGPADAKKVVGGKEVKIDSCLAAKDEHRQTVPSPDLADSKAVVSSVKIEIHEGCADKCNSQPDSVDSKGENQDACRHGKVEDGCTDMDGAVDSTLGSQCRLVVSSRNLRLVFAGESSLSAADKQAQGLLKSSSNHKQLLGVSGHLGAFDSRDSLAGKLDLIAAEVKKADAVGDSRILWNEEMTENASFPSADDPKLVVAPAPPANGIKEMIESKDTSSESNSHIKSESVNSQQSEHSAKQSSKKFNDDVSGKEDGKDDLVSSDEGSSLAAHTKSNATAKLDFDLNEGIPGDDGHQSEPTISPLVCSTVHATGLSPFTSPSTCGLRSAPITVAAPAKGPFVPPESLLRAKPEIRWKGSAATSAFRPAEPRKILEMPASTRDIPVSHTAGKQSRPMLGFDLNVAGDQALQEDIPESSAQTTCSEPGNMKSRDDSSRSAGIELDLNRANEVADNGQFVPNASHTVELPLSSTRSLPGIVSNSGMNISRDFDLNSGPVLDDAITEPVPKNLPAKNTGSIQFLQVPGLRMNNVAMSNISPWLASANPCGPVAIQSFLPSKGEQLYQIEAVSGAQRIIAATTDSGQFGGDPCRAPVISMSPAMFFPPPAYQYAGFPSFPPNVHLQAPAFSVGSATFANSASAVPYFSTLSPPLVGPAGSLPAQHSRQYAINLAESSSSSGRDSSRKWETQGLDLNSGPGNIDLEGKDSRVPLPVRQNLITPPHGFAEDQGRNYQIPVVSKRNKPDGSWDTERSTYKQLSWQ